MPKRNLRCTSLFNSQARQGKTTRKLSQQFLLLLTPTWEYEISRPCSVLKVSFKRGENCRGILIKIVKKWIQMFELNWTDLITIKFPSWSEMIYQGSHHMDIFSQPLCKLFWHLIRILLNNRSVLVESNLI